MARVSIEERVFAAVRLLEADGFDKERSMGKLVYLWHDTQELEKTECTRRQIQFWLNIKDETELENFVKILVQCQILNEISADIFLIRGNSKHIKNIRKLKKTSRNNGKLGGRPKKPRQNPEVTRTQNLSDNHSAIQYSAVQYSATQHSANESISAGSPTEKLESPSKKTWESYAKAYETRYRTPPVRNATVNAQLSQFVKRLGQEEAPFVAAFFVEHNDSFYQRSGHSVGIMLQNAEKLRTEWKTGRQINQSTIRVNEKTNHAQDQLARIARGEL